MVNFIRLMIVRSDMGANFVLFLCIALIFAADKVDGGEAQVLSSSNLTDARSEVASVTTNVIDDDSIKSARDDSKHMSHDDDINTHLGDGSEMIKKASSDHSKSEIENGKEEEATRKESSRKTQGEDCDPSNMCTDEQHQFVACLRVPGNDAPHLSLLIKNKAKTTLLLTITAPSFVRLEKKKVQLLQNQDTKVIVSIKKGASNDSAIILASSNGHCSLELKDLAAAAHETGNDDTIAVSRPSILNISSRTLIVTVMISFLVLSLVIIPVIIHVYRSKSQGKGKYQRLDMELPVSNAALVSTSDQETGDDGWNNNWGDDWDDENGGGDEEQPNTPVLPLTPSVSSRGLAPRRLSKEGWKD